jgi:quercetin dioxygenase-like cupin family protein
MTAEEQPTSPVRTGKRTVTPYMTWRAAEGVPVHSRFYVPSLLDLDVGDWDRLGARGAFLDLDGVDEGQGSYVLEVPAKAETIPQRHLYEEMVYVVSGSGATSVWVKDKKKAASFEWQAGSIFALPINSWYQHFNGDADTPARMLVVTTAPAVINLFHSEDFVFANDYVFTDRFNGDPDYFDASGEERRERTWHTNFLPDAYTFPLQDYPERGAGGRNKLLEVGVGSTLAAHISEFPTGTYKKAHRHGPGAHVVILSGQGYSLMWQDDGDPKQRCDWRPGSLIVPPERWFHQHFNTGPEPARYIALRWGGSRDNPLTRRTWAQDAARSAGGDQIEYSEEDPSVLELFEKATAAAGATSNMARFF